MIGDGSAEALESHQMIKFCVTQSTYISNGQTKPAALVYGTLVESPHFFSNRDKDFILEVVSEVLKYKKANT